MVRATVYLQLDPGELLLHIRPVHTSAVMRIQSGSVHSHMMCICFDVHPNAHQTTSGGGFDAHWPSIQFCKLITWAIIPMVV